MTLCQIMRRLPLAIFMLGAILFSGCNSANSRPVISSLETSAAWVLPSASIMIECTASDEDGDSLEYTWSAANGIISGTGPVVIWTAPGTPGTYTIKVEVADSKGAKTTGKLSTNVLINNPPVITSLTANPAVVNQAETATIQCVATDPDGDEVSYRWSATGGNISGQGATVTWTAPMICAEYVIMVTVVDTKGSRASRDLTIKVKKPG